MARALSAFITRATALGAITTTAGFTILSAGTALAAPAAPSPATIACSVSTGFLSQGSPTQLYAEQFGSGTIAFNAVGDTSAGLTYNAISVSPVNGYIYGVETSPTPGNLLRINPTNASIEDLGATSPALPSGLVTGSFDASGSHYYVTSSNSSTLYDVDVVAGTVSTIALSGSTGLADFTVVGGYLWGFKSNAPVRVDPSTGQVTTFSTITGMATGTYGAAFTLGNGDGEFGNNSGGVTEVHIDNPSSATPTFTVIATSASNSASTNDGAACVSAATHLAVSTSSPTTVVQGGTVTWTVTVTNEGPATSSGFTLTDALPTGYTPTTMTTGCSANGTTVTCTHGTVNVGDTTTISISATAPSSGSCGTGSVPNTISVQGNEADSDPGNANSTSSPTICVTGATPQSIDFPTPSDANLSDGTTTLAATADSGLTVGYTSTTPSVCTVSGGTVTLLTVGICSIDADQPGDGTYEPAPTIVRSFTISDAGGSGSVQTQEITFPQPADANIAGGTVSLTATADSGLTVSYTSTTPSVCTVSGSTVTLVARGTCTVLANQPGDSTYAAASTVTRSFVVSGEAQTIDFPVVPDVAAADGTVSVTATASSGLAVSFTSSTPSVCTVAGTTVTLVAPGICTIAADQPGNGTYAPANTIIRSFAVTDGGGASGSIATQVITFPQPANVRLADGTVALHATSTSGLAVTYTSLTPSVCTVAGSTATLVATGTCALLADQPGDSTYAAASTVAQSFTVAGAPQAITFTDPGSTDVSSGTVTLAATSDSGLRVSYTSTTPSVCTVAGNTVTLTATGGVCTILADQPGDATHAAAPTITRSFPVTGGSGGGGIDLQTIAFPQPPASPVSAGTVTLGATSDSGLPVVYTSTTPSVCTVSGNIVTLLGTGNCTINADQGGDGTHAAASTVTESFVVNAASGGGGGGSGTASPTVVFNRIGGSDRDATAAQLATTMYPAAGSAKVVLLARNDLYPDALTGSPLAAALDGPILLTPTATLAADARTAIQQVLPAGGLVICLGGTSAISPAVVSQLQTLGYRVERIGGADRYATAALIADRLATIGAVSNVYLATGLNFADALPAATAAGEADGVVLLTAGTSMPSATKNWMAAHARVMASAIGGAAASADPAAVRFVGTDRYATAAQVATAVTPSATGIVLATGVNFPDGLAGAVYAIRNGWSLLLVSPSASALNAAQSTYLHGASATVTTVTTIGGTTAVPEAATDLVRNGLQ